MTGMSSEETGVTDTGNGDTEEKGEDDSPTTKVFQGEQARDPTLGKAQCDARVGTGGMFIENGRLFRWGSIAGTKAKQLVLPKSRRGEVLLLVHESLWGGHLGPKKTRD